MSATSMCNYSMFHHTYLTMLSRAAILHAGTRTGGFAPRAAAGRCRCDAGDVAAARVARTCPRAHFVRTCAPIGGAVLGRGEKSANRRFLLSFRGAAGSAGGSRSSTS